MSGKRTKLSGAEYRKRAEEKKKKEKETISQTLNIQTFFKKKPDSDELIENPLKLDSDELVENLMKTDDETLKSDINVSCEITNVSICPSQDPALWDINSDMVDYFIRNPVESNPKIINFDNTIRKCGEFNRKLPYDIFKRKLLNGEIKDREWLLYSTSKNALFCFYCLLFSNKKTQFSSTDSGFTDWKKYFEKVEQHEKNLTHNESIRIWFSRRKITTGIDVELKIELEKKELYWRKLIAKFDPLMSNHLDEYGNKGRGNVSCLPHTICDELITLTNKSVLHKIVNEITSAKYFSLIVDSTPDITKFDQLTIAVRYVNLGRTAVERFLCFIPSVGHKSKEMEVAILTKLSELNIDIQNCRGQSYDNVRNMSGIFNGLQARIKEKSKNAIFSPCSAHSLNLVGCHAADITKEDGHPDIVFNIDHKTSVRHEAESLYKKIETLEFSFMIALWTPILERFDATSKNLQRINIDLSCVVKLYESLEMYVQDLRNRFDNILAEAKQMIGYEVFSYEEKRNKRKKCFHDDLNVQDTIFHGQEKFKNETFLPICDTIIVCLNERKMAYIEINTMFGFFLNIEGIDNDILREKSKQLVVIYSEDLEPDLENEIIQFKTILLKLFVSIPCSNASGERSFSVLKRVKNYQRTSLSNEKMSSLALMSIENNLLQCMDWNSFIKEFASQKARKKF
ncbi:zinc finger MYM-type protein 1-like [Rhopalosiphum maidis]|uniref:zinc finger MYM-type protein 1-like n=1 Tax=Rhopalosiphum maidis TaxID=43146 RepID=UPI000EFE3112|nr:zinc finger MYM-type protein 1-like [Rhopalosiphum maidis]